MAMCVLLLSAQFNLLSAQTTMKIWKGGCVTTSISTEDIDSVTFETTKIDLGDGVYLINGHKFIDLGLPSGLLWAETNIGAETAYDDGYYYAWGETSTKEDYSTSTYKGLTIDTTYSELYEKYIYTEIYSKYNETDGKTVLDKEDDAAYVNWGTSCRMPTKEDWVELANSSNCTWVWVSRTNSNGEPIKCYKVVSKRNNNMIYLPASGDCCGNGNYSHGEYGNYWSSTRHSELEYILYLNFTSSSYLSESVNRRSEGCGFSVRPVASQLSDDSSSPVISFGLKSSTPMTRTTQAGGDEAAKINNEFIVWGEKEETDATTADANIVFKNYRVQYEGNDGNTTSNTNGWEYVGIVPYTSYVTPTEVTQSVKYWDFGKTYTFTAVSALSSDITTGKVKITKNYTDASKMAQGYDIELYKGADASAIYVADRKEVSYDVASVSPVEMEFSNIQSKMRFGFYETVPGYRVQITGVKYNNAQTASTTFGVDGDFIQMPSVENEKLTYVVSYDSGNKPVVTINRTTPTSVAYQTFGNKIFNTNLGTSSTNATFDLDSNSYTSIIPNTENVTPISFTVDLNLYSEDTNELIRVIGCPVVVPATYCQWKFNHAYTYLFKVSYTPNSSSLYQVILDGVAVEDGMVSSETITRSGGTTR